MTQLNEMDDIALGEPEFFPLVGWSAAGTKRRSIELPLRVEGGCPDRRARPIAGLGGQPTSHTNSGDSGQPLVGCMVSPRASMVTYFSIRSARVLAVFALWMR